MLIRETRVCWGKRLEVLLVPTSLSPPPCLPPHSCAGGQSHKQTSVLPQAVGWDSLRELKIPFGVGSPPSVSI